MKRKKRHIRLLVRNYVNQRRMETSASMISKTLTRHYYPSKHGGYTKNRYLREFSRDAALLRSPSSRVEKAIAVVRMSYFLGQDLLQQGLIKSDTDTYVWSGKYIMDETPRRLVNKQTTTDLSLKVFNLIDESGNGE